MARRTSTPATPCGRAVMLNPPPILLGSNIPPTPTTFALPIPNLPGLVGVRVCMQYICFDTVGCTEVSQGVDITIQP